MTDEARKLQQRLSIIIAAEVEKRVLQWINGDEQQRLIMQSFSTLPASEQNESVIICVNIPEDGKLIVSTNQRRQCAMCKRPVQARWYVPAEIKTLCRECAGSDAVALGEFMGPKI